MENVLNATEGGVPQQWFVGEGLFMASRAAVLATVIIIIIIVAGVGAWLATRGKGAATTTTATTTPAATTPTKTASPTTTASPTASKKLKARILPEGGPGE